MERSKKSDEQRRALDGNFAALLFGCNFSKNSASYIAERSGKQIHYAN